MQSTIICHQSSIKNLIMEQEKLIALPLTEDTGMVDIMTVAKILSCDDRTIKSYVKKGLFPKPIKVIKGRRYFYESEILTVLGIDDLNEELKQTSECARYLEITVPKLREFIKKGYLTEIKLLNNQGSGGWLRKKQVESFKTDFVIESVSIGEQEALDIRKNNFIKLCFNNKNINVWKEILSEDEVNLLKMVLVDNKDYDIISKELNKSKDEIIKLWVSTNNRLSTRINKFPELVRRNERMKLEKELEDKILDCKLYIQDAHIKLQRKVKTMNKSIGEAKDKIKIKKEVFKFLIPEISESRKEEVLKIRLSDLSFSVRALNAFRYTDVVTIDDLIKLKPNDITKCRNIGKLTTLEIRIALNKLGITWEE
jgi:DNA-binding transcriptional MerR regulator